MIPFLTYPLALAALAAVPALAAIYILRNRFRRRAVSSLVLWRFHVQSKTGGAKIHRLQLPLLFFLELLALILLAAAAAGPRWKLPQSSRPLIVVLDDSFSMRAAQDNVSAQSKARDFLAQLYRHQPPPSSRLVLAGSEPRSLGDVVKTWREIDALLPQWQCRAPASSLDAAITLATELGHQEANILVLTDKKPAVDSISNKRLEWHAFGRPLDNFAIINASRTAFGDSDRCLLEIANYSPAAGSSRVQFFEGTNVVQDSDLALGPKESRRLVFNLASGAGSLRAVLAPDALTGDNEVQLLPPIRPRVRVQVSLTNEYLSSLVDRALDSTGLRASISADPQLVIHETDTAGGPNAWNVAWPSAGATNAYAGPFIVDSSRPLANGIALQGVIWAGAAATNAPGDVPVILAGNIPLLSERDDNSGRGHLTVNLAPALSTLQNTPDWPILFWNILQWRIAGMPGLKESNARLGEEVMLKTTGDPVDITLPDGSHVSYPKTGGELALDTPVTGIYSIAMGQSTNLVSVNALAADESDLSICATGQWGKWSEDAEHRLEEASAVWVFGLLGLALMTGHLYLVATGKGGS